MKPRLDHSVALVAFFVLTGCSSVTSTVRRTGIIGLGAAAAGAGGYFAGGRRPTSAAGGAIAGAALTNLALGEDPKTRQLGFDQGYIQGQSDAIKRQYFLRRALESEPVSAGEREGAVVYYVMPGPEVTADGRKLEPHEVAVRVIE